MFSFSKKLVYTALTVAMLGSISSCTKYYENDLIVSGDGEQSDKYAIWLQLGSWPNTAQYVLGVPSLSSGSVDLKGNGAEVTSKADYGIIPYKGFYYYPSTSATTGRFTKFQLSNNNLGIVKEVPFTYQSSISGYAFANDTTLIMVGSNGAGGKVLCSVVNTNTLEIRNVELPVNAIPTGFTGVRTRSATYANGRLYVNLAYSATWPAPEYQSAITAIYEFPSLTLVKQLEDSRSSSMGQSNMWMQGTHVDEKGDIYELAQPVGATVTLPSAIYRIRNGAAEYDPEYFFNLNNTLGGAAVALYGIGNGKAIVKYKALPDDGTDAGHIFAYAVIDLPSAKLIRKLNELPLDKGEMLETVTRDGNTVYIMVNAESEKDYVWMYDVAKDQATPGLEVVGGYDYMLRVDKVK
ncbi:DUF4374 domain-containing protein [Chitinophaga sp. sic0106]|uniref:DUF4374 domain-containing protein n=1 Tax=Chitinophaga sp. sic0106 TaxID=2854785 RepID=UPI001C45A640|nr:DUF4374 domain-containing protein [Chitinophaga sp. sic0106]MBV7529855.1 DUF4374 domain-containing protein [Chitinophaga sp. sic0106]